MDYTKDIKELSDCIGVWTDSETGVQYVIFYGYRKGGITPRLNTNGTLYTINQNKDNIDEIIDKKHPTKTYIQDFFEKFPHALKESDRPCVCRALIYGEEPNCFYREEPNCFKIDCKECWNQFMRGE